MAQRTYSPTYSLGHPHTYGVPLTPLANNRASTLSTHTPSHNRPRPKPLNQQIQFRQHSTFTLWGSTNMTHHSQINHTPTTPTNRPCPQRTYKQPSPNITVSAISGLERCSITYTQTTSDGLTWRRTSTNTSVTAYHVYTGMQEDATSIPSDQSHRLCHGTTYNSTSKQISQPRTDLITS
jgi:hypothetical protein